VTNGRAGKHPVARREAPDKDAGNGGDDTMQDGGMSRMTPLRALRPGPAMALGLPGATFPGAALAHHAMGDGRTPQGWVEGLLSGLAHPVVGPDHLAFLLAAGVLAAGCRPSGGRLPLLFVAASLAGTLLHLGGLVLGPVELAVAVSVLLAGGLLLIRPGAAASQGVLAALFLGAGLVHGEAFAESVVGAEPTPVLAYLAGLAVVQAAVAYGAFTLARHLGGAGWRFGRWAGAAATVVGAVALTAALAGV
jgi:urease accessory protein